MRKNQILTISLALTSLPTTSLHAAAPDPFALMKESDRRHRIPHERTEGTMILQKEGGEPKKRTLEILVAQDDREGDRMRVRFASPANIEGTALLSSEDPKDKDTEQWLYLPAFRKTRRVGKAELGDRFVGSDIYFEDMERRHVEDYSYKMLRSEPVEGEDCWVIESIPSASKVRKESPYGASHIWLRKDNLAPVRLRHFDKRNRPLKEVVFSELQKVSDEAWRANKSVLVDVKRRHRTVLLVSNRDVKTAPPEELLSVHRLGSM